MSVLGPGAAEKLALDAIDRSLEVGEREVDGPAQEVTGPIPAHDLGDPCFERHSLARGAGRHVGVRERVRHEGLFSREDRQLGGEPSEFSLPTRFAVVGHEGDDSCREVVLEVERAVEAVMTRDLDCRAPADVVQVGRGYQRLPIMSRQPCCDRSGGSRYGRRVATSLSVWGQDGGHGVRGRCWEVGSGDHLRTVPPTGVGCEP